jgi:hypothetical protein
MNITTRFYIYLNTNCRQSFIALLIFTCLLQGCSTNIAEDLMKNENKYKLDENTNIEIGDARISIRSNNDKNKEAQSTWNWKQMICTVAVVTVIHLSILLPIFFVKIDNYNTQITDLQASLTACLNRCP